MTTDQEPQLQKIVSALEDISIKSNDQQKEITNSDAAIIEIPHDIDSEFSEIDAKTIELVELVAKYEQLVNDDNRLNFINGFLNLSRANYNTGTISKRFGADFYDLRPHTACVSLQYKKDTFELVDLLEFQRAKTASEKALKKAKDDKKAITEEKEYRDEDSKESESETTFDEKYHLTKDSKSTALKSNGGHEDNQVLKKRGGNNAINSSEKKSSGTKEIDLESEKQTEKEIKVRDPIYQFGALAPYQLKQAQNYFSSALKESVRVVNIQNRISKLVNEIEILQKENISSTAQV
ncbi:uncharacterized protein RJT20DRAFT_127633 [Scheffersomyces xylosifermentans]|uniref:uncharacterized protein n=1 Tax=Scheffersomyces xylosifermentans TaxID=1304137 RepID=UPI00315CA42D